MGTKKVLSLFLSLTVMLSMCFGGITPVFAESETAGEQNLLETAEAVSELVASGDTILKAADVATTPSGSYLTAQNLNVGMDQIYYTPINTSNYTSYTYTVKMPSAGTLAVNAMSANNNSIYCSVYGTGVESQGSETTSEGVKIFLYTVASAQDLTVDLQLYATANTDMVAFQTLYVPNTVNTIAAPAGKFSKVYYHGGTGTTSKISQFKVTVPANGYLVLNIADDMSTYPVSVKTTGFKDYETIRSSDIERYIGVKKGTYTFSVKTYAPIYDIQVKFIKVSESKYGAKKKKAASLKAKKAAKGLIVTNSKKVHWYKFKNKKLHKVKVTTTTKLTNGSGSGGIRITVYDKKRKIGSKIIYANTASSSFYLYTVGKKNKLVKGTYYIKVESYNGGNGYFTVKWK